MGSASPDLTDDERQALVALLTDAIEASRFPLSPRTEPLQRIRAKRRGEEPARIPRAKWS